MRRPRSRRPISRRSRSISRSGARTQAELSWLDPPPAATLAGARDLLRRLDALDAARPRHGAWPRHAGARRASAARAHAARGARGAARLRRRRELAALLSERDLLRRGACRARWRRARQRRAHAIRGSAPAMSRAAAVTSSVARSSACAASSARFARARCARRSRRGPTDEAIASRACRARRAARVRVSRSNREAAAGRRARYQLANGRGASFAAPESIAREEFIVAVDLDDRERDARILLAAPLARADLLEHFAGTARRARRSRLGRARGSRGRAPHACGSASS